MKVLLTGSTGFLGKNIRYLLQRYGHEVICPRSPGFLENWDMLKDSSRRELFQNEIPDVIVHAAWGVAGSNYRESETNSEWRDATLSLYEEAVKHGVQHFVALGTFSENEEDLISGAESDNSLYAESKRQTRSEIFSLEQHLKIPVSWLRIQYPYGYWDRPNRLVPMITQKSILREEFSLRSPSLNLDFVHSMDVASAVQKVIENQIFGIIEVKSGVKYSLQDVKLKIEKVLEEEDNKVLNLDSIVELIETNRKYRTWIPSVPLRLGLSASINDLKRSLE